MWNYSFVSDQLYSIWGASGNGLYAAGALGNIFWYNGSGWERATFDGEWRLDGRMWQAPAVISMPVGMNGLIVHYDGSTWSEAMGAGGKPISIRSGWPTRIHIFAGNVDGKRRCITAPTGSPRGSNTFMTSGQLEYRCVCRRVLCLWADLAL